MNYALKTTEVTKSIIIRSLELMNQVVLGDFSFLKTMRTTKVGGEKIDMDKVSKLVAQMEDSVFPTKPDAESPKVVQVRELTNGIIDSLNGNGSISTEQGNLIQMSCELFARLQSSQFDELINIDIGFDYRKYDSESFRVYAKDLKFELFDMSGWP